MQNDLYPIVASALAVALLATAVFLGTARTWLVAARTTPRRSRFAQAILFEPGHRFRQELETVDGRYGAHLAGMLMFIVLFATVALLRPVPPIDVPTWAWMVLCASIALISLFIPFQTFRLHRAKARLREHRDAHLAVGHALQRVVSKGNRLFHNLVINGQIIDNVVVGANGVYVVSVCVYPPPGNQNAVAQINGNHLHLGNAKDPRALANSVKRVKLLSHALAKIAGHKIPVRSVIAVPGWEVGSTGTHGHLIVNEKTVVTLSGWTRTDAFLMDEDVDKVCEALTEQCRRSKTRRRRRRPAPSKANKSRGSKLQAIRAK